MFAITTASGTIYRVTQTHVFRAAAPADPGHCRRDEIVAAGVEAAALFERCAIRPRSIMGRSILVGPWTSTPVTEVVDLLA